MRGLKPTFVWNVTVAPVASFTDAWIETLWPCPNPHTEIVASFTDAWIETNEKDFWLLSLCRIFYRCVD